MINLYRFHTDPGQLDQQGMAIFRAEYANKLRVFNYSLYELRDYYRVNIEQLVQHKQYKLTWHATDGSGTRGVILVDIAPDYFEVAVTVGNETTNYGDSAEALRRISNAMNIAEYDDE